MDINENNFIFYKIERDEISWELCNWNENYDGDSVEIKRED